LKQGELAAFADYAIFIGRRTGNAVAGKIDFTVKFMRRLTR
jgi:hypothetical protein